MKGCFDLNALYMYLLRIGVMNIDNYCSRVVTIFGNDNFDVIVFCL